MAQSKRRQARDDACAARVAPPATGLSDGDWKKLEKTLPCLLSVELQSPSTAANADPLCPRAAWLVVHLDRVATAPSATKSKKPRSSPRLLENLSAVVDAVAALCDEAARLRTSETIYEEFWTRLLHSDILEAPPAEMKGWMRYPRKHGTPVLFSWCGKKLEAGPVAEALRGFLTSPSRDDPKQRRFGIFGLRFEQCELAASDVERIHELLKRPEIDEGDLVDLGARQLNVRLLSVSCNALDTDALIALAALLEDPAAANVTELGLDGIMPTSHASFMTPANLAAYQRVLTPPPTTTKDPQSTALSLTLTRNVAVDAEPLWRLKEALVVASRPLRSLTIAKIKLSGLQPWFHLATLILTRYPTADPDCELHFGWIGDTSNFFDARHAIYTALEHLVVEAVPRLRDDGILAGRPVACRLMNTIMFHDEQLTERKGSDCAIGDLSSVEEVSDNGRFRIALPDGADSGWVSSSSVAKLQIGDCVVVGSSFSSLTFDTSGNVSRRNHTAGFLRDLLWVLGANLKKFSLVNSNAEMASQLSSLLRSCPILKELHIENAALERGIVRQWIAFAPEVCSSLEALKVGGCDLDAYDVLRLREFKALRYLSVKHNAIGEKGLRALLQILQESDSLQFVEVSDQPGDEDDVRAEIDCFVRYELMSTETKVAFLSVVGSLGASQPATSGLTTEMITQIFQSVGTGRGRVVKWC